MRFVGAGALLLAASLACTPAPVLAQPPASIVVGSENLFSPIVGDLDKAVFFYRGLGFDVPGQPSDATTNAPLRDLFGLPDAGVRWLVGVAPGVAGSRVEIVEIKGAKGRASRRDLQHAGAFTLVLTVRDLDAAAFRLHESGARVLTPGNEPLLVSMDGEQTRMLTARAPDGHFVELVQVSQAASTAVPSNANILEARVRLTVQDLDRALQLYHDALGLPLLDRSGFSSDRTLAAALGAPGARFRSATLQVPQSGLLFELIEFAGKRRALRSNIQDPGSTRLQLRVRSVDEAIAALEKFGGEVISTGGKGVEMPTGAGRITAAMVRDPDNLFLVLLGAPVASR